MTIATWFADLRTLAHMARGLPEQGGASRQLEAFYGPQAGDYDRFRERLLQGRRELIEALRFAPGQSVVEFGAGTGRMVDFYREQVADLARVDLVDLCSRSWRKPECGWAACPRLVCTTPMPVTGSRTSRQTKSTSRTPCR